MLKSFMTNKLLTGDLVILVSVLFLDAEWMRGCAQVDVMEVSPGSPKSNEHNGHADDGSSEKVFYEEKQLMWNCGYN